MNTEYKNNQDDAAIAIIVAWQLAKKLKLESSFKIILAKFFKQVANDAATVWLSTQTSPSLQYFNAEVVSMLRSHYRRVSKVFGKEFQSRIGVSISSVDKEKISHDIIKYINSHSITQANYILNTTENDLKNIADNVLITSKDGELLTNTQIAANIKNEFNFKSDSRISTIAQTETQIMAEQTKQIEANNLNEILINQESSSALVKQWGAILDNRTRRAHAEADYQIRKLKEPFIVGGEKMMHPGDTTLGASLSNICNCRCCSIITLP